MFAAGVVISLGVAAVFYLVYVQLRAGWKAEVERKIEKQVKTEEERLEAIANAVRNSPAGDVDNWL